MEKTNTKSQVQKSHLAGMLAAVMVLLLAGCAAGPNYHAPKTEVAKSFTEGTDTNMSTNETSVTWWRGFNDTELNSLIDRAVRSNQDLRVATANILQARALHHQAQFDLLPVPQAQASYTHELFSQAFEPGVPRRERDLELYDGGFDATWELDFFGRLRRANQAASAEEQAAIANRRDVMVTLISEVARNYFELLGAQEELAVARGNATNQSETTQITQSMLEGGRGTQLDVDRARAELNNTLAIIPPLQAAIEHARHRLAVLTGQQPNALDEELKSGVPLPGLPEMVSIGDPAALLRRRPDIRSAERSLAAATARIGVATADLFPRVTFNGNLDVQAASFAGLTESGADTWAFGPSITWAILDYGHVKSRMNAAHAEADASLAIYERTVLTALEETENSFVDFSREEARREFLRQSESSSASAAKLARQRYEDGVADFLTVLDAERVLFAAQDQLAQSNTRTYTALVAVYKALGGGWEIGEGKRPVKDKDAGWPNAN